MGEYTPPPPKPPRPPAYKSYAERKAAEEKIRANANKQTHQDYKLPPVPPPGKHEGYRPRPDPIPSADGTPTRDMEPVKIPLKRKIQGEYADVLPFTRKKEEHK